MPGKREAYTYCIPKQDIDLHCLTETLKLREIRRVLLKFLFPRVARLRALRFVKNPEMSPIYRYCFLVTQKRLHGFSSWPCQKVFVLGRGDMNLLFLRLERFPRAQGLVLLFTCSFQIIHIPLVKRVLQCLRGVT